MIRPMTDDERQRAIEKEKANMTHSTLIPEVMLHGAMKRTNLTLEEAIEAMQRFANDKQFQKDLDKTYQNMIVDDWDAWHEGDID